MTLLQPFLPRPKTIAIVGQKEELSQASARQLSAAGHNVLLLGKDLRELDRFATELGPRAFPVFCDMHCNTSIDDAFHEIGEDFGRLDALVAMLSADLDGADAACSTAVASERLLTRMHAQMRCIAAAARLMTFGGRIISIVCKPIRPTPSKTPFYELGKAGLERFCAAIRSELSNYGVSFILVGAGLGSDQGRKARSVLRSVSGSHTENLETMSARDFRTYIGQAASMVRHLIELPQELAITGIDFEPGCGIVSRYQQHSAMAHRKPD